MSEQEDRLGRNERFEEFRGAAITFLEQDTMHHVGSEEDRATIARYIQLIDLAETPKEIIGYLAEVAAFAPGALK